MSEQQHIIDALIQNNIIEKRKHHYGDYHTTQQFESDLNKIWNDRSLNLNIREAIIILLAYKLGAHNESTSLPKEQLIEMATIVYRIMNPEHHDIIRERD